MGSDSPLCVTVQGAQGFTIVSCSHKGLTVFLSCSVWPLCEGQRSPALSLALLYYFLVLPLGS